MNIGAYELLRCENGVHLPRLIYQLVESKVNNIPLIQYLYVYEIYIAADENTECVFSTNQRLRRLYSLSYSVSTPDSSRPNI